MTARHAHAALLACSLVAMGGCRGSITSEPPIHIVPNMDWQPKYEAQEESAFFEDGRSMRPIVDGTVARGQLREDDTYYRGMKDGAFVATVPFEVDETVIRRGQDRYNIFCTPCHDATGAGQGTVVQRGYPRPVSLSSEHPRTIGDGEIYSYITNGIRNMPAYGHQIPVRDRWAIVSWVRVLQRSQHAALADVPTEKRASIEQEVSP